MNNPNNPQSDTQKKALFGLIILLLGVGLLLKTMGLFSFLRISITWPVILIAVGFFVGVQKKFTNNAWWILILIGAINLIPRFSFYVGDHYVRSKELIIPAFFIIGGLFMILRPKRNYANFNPKFQQRFTPTGSNTLNTDVVFGGRKEIITSKDFQGGNVTATFGGCEINLLQADATQSIIELTVRATFGGIEVIVPSHWDVKSEVETIFGSTQDERSIRMQDTHIENKKTLILRGSCVFGSVEIKSI